MVLVVVRRVEVILRSISKLKIQFATRKDFLLEGFDRATLWRCSTCVHHVTLKWPLDWIVTPMFDLLMLLITVSILPVVHTLVPVCVVMPCVVLV